MQFLGTLSPSAMPYCTLEGVRPSSVRRRKTICNRHAAYSSISRTEFSSRWTDDLGSCAYPHHHRVDLVGLSWVRLGLFHPPKQVLSTLKPMAFGNGINGLEDCLRPAPIPVQVNVEAWAEPVAVRLAEFGDPRAALVQDFGAGALRH